MIKYLIAFFVGFLIWITLVELLSFLIWENLFKDNFIWRAGIMCGLIACVYAFIEIRD